MDSARAQELLGRCGSARDERRVMCRALAFWELQREDERLPRTEGFNPFVLQDLVPNVYMVRLGASVANSDFIYCGATLAEACGGDLTGRSASSIRTALRDAMIDFFQGAIRYRQPLADSGGLFASGRDILYRNIVMPLGDEHDEVAAIYGAFSFKIDA